MSESIARPIARELIEHGKVTRPYIGLVMQSLTPALSRALGPRAPERGAIVSEVQRSSPADQSGIRVGDIVLQVGDTPTQDSRDVQQAVLEHEIGETLEIRLWRDGGERTLRVRTTELQPEAATSPEPGERERELGLRLETLTPELAERLGLERAATGVLVSGVRRGSSAAEAGIREWDVIDRIDGEAVVTADQAAARLRRERPGGHLLRIVRGDAALFIAIPDARETD